MRVACFDPFSGASGDMVLGALIDAGLPIDELRAGLSNLPLEGYQIDEEHLSHNAVRGVRVRVLVTAEQPSRNWSEIQTLIGSSSLSESARQRALAVFEALALAEASVHQTPVQDVHFHEVGALDSIIDICGAAIGFDFLGIEHVYSLPVRTGSGFVQSQHGLLPVPAPATAQLIANAGAPVLGMPVGYEHIEAELLTPTGAAILTTLARFETPAYEPERVAYGFGAKELPWPNALRLWIGEEAAQIAEAPSSGENGWLVELATNIDDMSPQAYELLVERLFESGALDVWLTPVQMKKGRPGTIVSILARERERDDLEAVLFDNSPTLGVRRHRLERTVLDREFDVVATRFGDVRLKLKIRDGRIASAAPEYEDCADLARRHERPFLEVWEDARRMGDRLIGASRNQPAPGE